MKVFTADKSTGKPKKIVFLGPVPERPISINPGFKFCSIFCILHSYALLWVTFCVIITVSHSKGSTVS